MRFTNGSQFVEAIPGKRVVKSGATGATNVAEVKWLTDRLVSSAAAWKAQGWGYLVDISKMDPATPEVSNELVNLHKALTAAGCKAMAFVTGFSFILDAQAKEHGKQSQSTAVIQEAHFRTEEEALAWFDTILK